MEFKMQITLAQLDFIIGDFEGNTSKILAAVAEAKQAGSELICFSELSICGYPPRDFLEFEDFIRRCRLALEQIATHSHDIGIVVGVPVVNPEPEGKDLYNAAVFLYEGRVLHTYHKCLLPTYDVFDEYRYFEPGSEFKIVEFKGKRIALTVCEDIWNIGNENPLYINCPMDVLILQNPDFVLNLSASPFAWNHSVNRLNIIRTNVERYKVPFFYVNQVGAQTEILFDGGSVVMSANAKVWDEMPYFESCVRHYKLEEVINSQGPGEQVKDKITLIRQALVCGIKGYFEKLGLKKAILGLSGGIDSALTCALAVEALGAENVRGVMMPSSYSSSHSVDDAVSLAKNLGIRYDIVPIKSVYEPYLELLNPLFEGKPFDVTEENIQARNRGMILMALSNKWGYILLNTTNKSEMAVGYGTLYGDMCGGLSVLGDVYKMEVYALAENINKDKELIPQNSITKPPSAELRPGQKDSDSLPPYPLLDEILYEYIELRQGPRDIIANGFDEPTVRRVLKLVNTNEFKRHQTAPVLRVSSKAFGMGRRMPIVGKYLS
jgi:NAD+ synthase (glutamine-hydrolysing)